MYLNRLDLCIFTGRYTYLPKIYIYRNIYIFWVGFRYQVMNHSPTTMSVKSNPRFTALRYTWLGRLAKPTYPSNSFRRFSFSDFSLLLSFESFYRLSSICGVLLVWWLRRASNLEEIDGSSGLAGTGGPPEFIDVTKAGAGDDSFLKNNSRLLCKIQILLKQSRNDTNPYKKFYNFLKFLTRISIRNLQFA